MDIFLNIENKEIKVHIDRDGVIGAIHVDDVLADGRPGHKNPEHYFAVKHDIEITTEAMWHYDDKRR